MPAADPRAAAGAIEATRRKLRAAADQIRRAQQNTAKAAEGFDVIGVVQVTDEHSAARAHELILLALSEHQDVDVVVLTSTPNHHSRSSGRGG